MLRFLKRRFHGEGALCLAMIFVLAIAGAFPLIFLDRLPIRSGGLAALPPWEGDNPAALSEARLATAVEEARLFASYRFLNENALKGESLLWNPTSFAGTPFLAQWNTRCLSPFSLPFYVLTLQQAYAVSMFLKLLLAGWIAYYVARVLGVSRSIALFIGVTQQCSGYFLLWLHHPVSDVIPWIPLLFLYAERLSLGQARYWPMGALALALMLLGGDPAAVVAAIAFFALYVAARLRVRQPEVTIALPAIAGAASVAVAIGLTAVQILPYLQWLGQSAPDAAVTRYLPDITQAIGALTPHWTTEALGAGDQRSLALVFIGPVQILLACLWISLRAYMPQAQRRRVDALLIIHAAFTVGALLLGPLGMRAGGVARVLTPEHLLVACPFALALACGLTAEAWLQLRPQQCLAAIKRFVLLFALAGVGFGALYALGTASGLRPGPERWLQTIVLGTATGISLLLLGVTLLKPRARLMAYTLVYVTVAQAYLLFAPMISFSSRDAAFPRTHFIQTLEETGDRAGGSPAMAQWPLEASGLASFYGGGDRIPRRHTTFVARLREDPSLVYRTASEALMLTRADLQGAYRPLRPALHVRAVFPSGVVLFDCPACGEDAWITGMRPGSAGTSMPAKMTARPVSLAEGEDQSPRRVAGAIAIASDSNIHMTIQLNAPEGGTLVLSRAYYPGWRATVDGRSQPVFPVDDMFLGVKLGEGSREVLLEYRPEPVYWGRLISICAAAIVLIGIGNLFYYRLHDTYFRV